MLILRPMSSPAPNLTTPDATDLRAAFAGVQALVAADMARVDARIREELRSDVVLIQQIGAHIVHAGGKRLRPMLVLLCARAQGDRGSDAAVALAAIVEFIHTATLLHDDVVDESDLRRGRKTANAMWGNAASVLVGDFLYSRSFQMMVGLDRMAVMRVLADTTNAIAEGEVLQLLNMGDPDTTEARYLEVIRRKTAILFAAAGSLGALVAERTPAEQQTMHEFGLALGMAFQIADDVLDYTGDAALLGKNLGDDLAEGKPTLPVIIAQRRADAATADAIREAVREGNREALPLILRAIRDTDAVDASLQCAREYAARAEQLLESLPATPWREALRTLSRFSVERDR